MPAYAEHRRTIRPRERAFAFAAVALVQLAVGLALLRGLQVEVVRPGELVQRLVEVTLPKPPPVRPRRISQAHSAPKAAPEKLGGSRGPQPTHAPPAVVPAVPVMPAAPPSGGGVGTGPALGAGSGGGTGGAGYGEGNGAGNGAGGEAELISGDITPRDYPKRLGNAGVGGTVSVTFTVESDGRVTGCRLAKSSGVPELDALTCRLIEQRFRFRPATDRAGRPISDEVDWDQDWIPHR